MNARFVVSAAVVLLGALHAAWVRGDERFVLEVPNQPRLRSTVTIDARELTIVDGAGERHVYARHPEHDTDDGLYRAYYSAAARRFLRWPVDGRGKMLLGSRAGDALEWTASRMEVRRVGRAPDVDPPAPRERVGRDPDDRDPNDRDLDDRDLVGAVESGPLAALTDPDGRVTVARVDGRGRLEVYEVDEENWRPWRGEASEPLPPAAGVALARQTGDAPTRVFAIGAQGDLVQLRGGGRWRTIAGPREARFLPGSRLAASEHQGHLAIMAIDDAGRLWSGDPDAGDWRALEEREGLLPPGAAIGVLSGAEPRALVVDRRGHLLEYRVSTRGAREPRRIASRLAPGSGVAIWNGRESGDPAGGIQLAAVDVAGRLGVWTADRSSWHQQIYRDVRLSPGAPLALGRRGAQLVVSAVQTDGRWGAWALGDDGFVAEPIQDGFWGGGPVVSAAGGLFLCAIDRTGRVVAARRQQGRWDSVLLGRHFAVAPRLAQRTITSEPPLPPAQVVFVNRHSEELVVRLFDRLRADVPHELVIAPGKSVRFRIERDSGAMLDEVFLAPTLGGGFHEEVRQIRIPPASRYTANVWVNRVTSVYFDRTTNQGPDPDEVNQSLVSLGVFPLPPGEELRDGARIDVYREATARRNPGAVRMLEPDPQP